MMSAHTNVGLNSLPPLINDNLTKSDWTLTRCRFNSLTSYTCFW